MADSWPTRYDADGWPTLGFGGKTREEWQALGNPKFLPRESLAKSPEALEAEVARLTAANSHLKQTAAGHARRWSEAEGRMREVREIMNDALKEIAAIQESTDPLRNFQGTGNEDDRRRLVRLMITCINHTPYAAKAIRQALAALTEPETEIKP